MLRAEIALLLHVLTLASKSPLIFQNPREAEKCQITTHTKSAMMETMVEVSLDSDKQLAHKARYHLKQIISYNKTIYES